MADVTPPPSQMDAGPVAINASYATTGAQHILSDDGLQYVDFNAFSNDAVPPRSQDTYGAGDGLHDTDMDADYAADEHAACLTEVPAYEEPNDTVVPHGAQMEDYQNGEEESDLYAEDDDTALFQAAFESYRNENPFHWPLVIRLPTDYERQLADPHGVACLEQKPGSEKWQVDKGTAEFLASVITLTADHDLEEILQRSVRNPLRKLKLDEPVFETHPETAMIKLFERNEVHLTNDGIEPFPLDAEKDEALQWSKKDQARPKTLHRELKDAKLELDASTVQFLKEIHKGPDVDLNDWLRKDRERRLPPRPLSPKLLPLSPPYSHDDLESDAAEVELTSSPSDPSAHEAADLAAKFVKRDEIRMQKDADEASRSWDEYAASSSSPPQQPKPKRSRSLKISSPLLPFGDQEPPSKKAKTVSFPDELEALIPPLSDDGSPDGRQVGEQIFATINSTAEGARAKLQKRMRNEDLVEADTTLRVPIAAIERVKMIAPWETTASSDDNTHGLNFERQLINDACNDLAPSEAKWSISSKSERGLHWLPFPLHLGKMKPEGEFDDGSLARYLQELDISDDPDLQRLVWKPDGLRLLDCDEYEDDELEPADFESDIDEPETEGIEPPRAPATIHAPQCGQPSAPIIRHEAPIEQLKSNQVPSKEPQAAIAQSNAKANKNTWTAMDELLHKRKIQLQEDGKALRNESGLDLFTRMQGLPKRVVQPSKSNGQSTEKQSIPKPRDDVPSPTNRSLAIPVPEIQTPSAPRQIIIASSLLQNYHFVRRLQKLLLATDLVERDFTGLSPEADITLSPSTALLLTNLQKLKQKPLPGSGGGGTTSGIHHKIALVAPRYERLILLVSDRPTLDDHTTELHTIDARDSSALADLMAKTTALEAEIQIIYVAGGTERLAHWTAATISRAANNAEHRLLREETLWERFLRKAGLNSYAAQVVLKGCMGGEQPALATFVTMEAEERVQRFGPIIGGDRLLRRVNRALEASWIEF